MFALPDPHSLFDSLTILYKAWIYGGHVDEAVAERSSTGESTADDAPKEEVVVAVMGVTGSGKSTFIRTMTGNLNVHVGHGLESGTYILLSTI